MRDACLAGEATLGLTMGTSVRAWECRRRSQGDISAGSPWGRDRPWMREKTMARVKAWLEQPLRQNSGPS